MVLQFGRICVNSLTFHRQNNNSFDDMKAHHPEAPQPETGNKAPISIQNKNLCPILKRILQSSQGLNTGNALVISVQRMLRAMKNTGNKYMD